MVVQIVFQFFLLLSTNYLFVESRCINLLSSNLQTWMTNLPQTLKETPIIHLAIPGSHNSGTYAITNTSETSPDADQILYDFGFLGTVVTDILARWSLTQPYSITQQLYSGIRYLDLRIATKENTDRFYFVHNLYSAEADQDFRNMNDFLDAYPGEIVILDCQHFHALDNNDHRRFQDLLIATFGQKLQPFVRDVRSVTLQSMVENEYQVIVIYREAPTALDAVFWLSDTLPNPWANTVSVPQLIDYLTDSLRDRDSSIGFVSQCILTPSIDTILQHEAGDLKTECFDSLEEEKYNWLNNQTPGPGGVNIIISDFVDNNNDAFSKAVIALNQKLIYF